MRGKRHPPAQQAALAALSTHVWYELVADVCGVKEHTVEEWQRRHGYSGSYWVALRGDALEVLFEYARGVQEAGSPRADEFMEGVLSVRGAADFADLTRQVSIQFPVSLAHAEGWESPAGEVLVGLIGPYPMFLAAPHMQHDRIDFVRLGAMWRFAHEISHAVNVLPCEPDAVALMERAKPVADILANSPGKPRTHAEAVEIQEQANLVIESLMDISAMHSPYYY